MTLDAYTRLHDERDDPGSNHYVNPKDYVGTDWKKKWYQHQVATVMTFHEERYEWNMSNISYAIDLLESIERDPNNEELIQQQKDTEERIWERLETYILFTYRQIVENIDRLPLQEREPYMMAVAPLFSRYQALLPEPNYDLSAPIVLDESTEERTVYWRYEPGLEVIDIYRHLSNWDPHVIRRFDKELQTRYPIDNPEYHQAILRKYLNDDTITLKWLIGKGRRRGGKWPVQFKAGEYGYLRETKEV